MYLQMHFDSCDTNYHFPITIEINSATTAALQGNAALLIVAGQAYRSANTEVHITVDNSAGDMSAGTVKFVVEYVKLA